MYVIPYRGSLVADEEQKPIERSIIYQRETRGHGERPSLRVVDVCRECLTEVSKDSINPHRFHGYCHGVHVFRLVPYAVNHRTVTPNGIMKSLTTQHYCEVCKTIDARKHLLFTWEEP